MSLRWYGNEFWRFVFVQQEVEKLAQSFIDFPQAQAPASFNMDAIKAKVSKARAGHAGQ